MKEFTKDAKKLIEMLDTRSYVIGCDLLNFGMIGDCIAEDMNGINGYDYAYSSSVIKEWVFRHDLAYKEYFELVPQHA
jgi:hypothetical protein